MENSSFKKMVEESISFINIHKKIIQENQLSSMLDIEINKQKKQFDQKIKDIIFEARSLSNMIILYPSTSINDASQFLRSTVFQRENKTVYENSSSLPYSSKITWDINNFLKMFPNYLDIFYECVIIYFNNNNSNTNPEYNPFEKPLKFFAGSTFPSLFGFSWCVEFGANYAEAILHLLKLEMKKTDSLLSSQFRKSFIWDVVRHFLHIAGIQNFFHKVLSGNYWNLINENKINVLEQNSPQVLDILTRYLLTFQDDLLKSIDFMPSLLRYFFKRITEIDASRGNLLLELLFFDHTLQPAFLKPKLYLLIPASAPNPSNKLLTLLTKMVKWSLNHEKIPSDFGYLNNSSFSKINLRSITKEIPNIKNDFYVDGIYAQELIQNECIKFGLMQISVNDILFICKIVNESIDKVQEFSKQECEKLKNMCSLNFNYADNQAQTSSSVPELLDFWFQLYKLPDLPEGFPAHYSYEPTLALPIIVTPEQQAYEMNINKKDEFIKMILHLQKYLITLRPSESAPQNLTEFLEFQKERALRSSMTELLTKTKAIQNKIDRSGKSVDEILLTLQYVVCNGLKKSSKILNNSFKNQQFLTLLSDFLSESQNTKHQLDLIYLQYVIKIFNQRNKDIKENMEKTKSYLLNSQNDWFEYFFTYAKKLLSFAEFLNIHSQYFLILTKQLHSGLCLQLLSSKHHSSPNIIDSATDEIINNNYNNLLLEFQKRKKSNLILDIILDSNCLNEPILIFKDGVLYGTPLERLENIEKCILILKNIVNELNDENVQSLHKSVSVQIPYLGTNQKSIKTRSFSLIDNPLLENLYHDPKSMKSSISLKSLFMYVILKAMTPHLSTLSKYISYFLITENEQIKILTTKEKRHALLFINTVQKIIDSIQK